MRCVYTYELGQFYNFALLLMFRAVFLCVLIGFGLRKLAAAPRLVEIAVYISATIHCLAGCAIEHGRMLRQLVKVWTPSRK